MKPLIVRPPTPFFSARVLLLHRVKYLHKRCTIGVLYSTKAEITKITRDTGPRADIVMKERSGETRGRTNDGWNSSRFP